MKTIHALRNARKGFAVGMESSIIEFHKDMNAAFKVVALFPTEYFAYQKKRVLLKLKTIALIKMDRLQLMATENLEYDHKVIKEINEVRPTPKSAWFDGNPFERTFY